MELSQTFVVLMAKFVRFPITQLPRSSSNLPLYSLVDVKCFSAVISCLTQMTFQLYTGWEQCICYVFQLTPVSKFYAVWKTNFRFRLDNKHYGLVWCVKFKIQVFIFCRQNFALNFVAVFIFLNSNHTNLEIIQCTSGLSKSFKFFNLSLLKNPRIWNPLIFKLN